MRVAGAVQHHEPLGKAVLQQQSEVHARKLLHRVGRRRRRRRRRAHARATASGWPEGEREQLVQAAEQ